MENSRRFLLTMVSNDKVLETGGLLSKGLTWDNLWDCPSQDPMATRIFLSTKLATLKTKGVLWIDQELKDLETSPSTNSV